MNKALTLFDNFNQLTPYAVGFDKIFNDLARYTENTVTSTGFPPYNIRKDGDFNYVIAKALAGVWAEDLEVETSNGTLIIRSTKENTDNDNYDALVYQGIAYRKFERKFTLADDVVVNSADLVNGMLTINLERIVPEEKKPRLITIN